MAAKAYVTPSLADKLSSSADCVGILGLRLTRKPAYFFARSQHSLLIFSLPAIFKPCSCLLCVYILFKANIIFFQICRFFTVVLAGLFAVGNKLLVKHLGLWDVKARLPKQKPTPISYTSPLQDSGERFIKEYRNQ